MERLRRPLLFFYIGGAISFIGLLIFAAVALQGLKQMAIQGLGAGFFIGFSVGLMLGGLAMQLVHGLFTALMPQRTERLLLRYYDALTELAEQSAVAGERGENRPEPAATGDRAGQ
jgi:hypothetical protein